MCDRIFSYLVVAVGKVSVAYLADTCCGDIEYRGAVVIEDGQLAAHEIIINLVFNGVECCQGVCCIVSKREDVVLVVFAGFFPCCEVGKCAEEALNMRGIDTGFPATVGDGAYSVLTQRDKVL